LQEQKDPFFILVEKSVTSKYGEMFQICLINSNMMDRTTVSCNKKLKKFIKNHPNVRKSRGNF
jgi:hypothetical protein